MVLTVVWSEVQMICIGLADSTATPFFALLIYHSGASCHGKEAIKWLSGATLYRIMKKIFHNHCHAIAM